MNQYEQQANDFLKSVNAKIKIEYLETRPYFTDDKEARAVYKVRISRKMQNAEVYTQFPATKQFTLTFGASINDTERGIAPTNYDILACLTKSNPGTFEDFCEGYGYDNDSRKAEKLYKAVVKEWRNVEQVFGDCLEELREIN